LYLFSIGMLSKFTGWSLDACYQIGRFFISWALGISVYYFVALFLTGQARYWGWLMAIFAEGFGWILRLFNLCIQLFGWQANWELAWHPIDIAYGHVGEAFAFSSMLYVPLHAAAIAFLCITLRWAYIAIASNSKRTAFIAGCLLFLMSFIHPFDIIITITILSAAVALLTICYPKQWKQWIVNLAIICLCGVPPILYNYLVLNTNPGFTMWEKQNNCISPAILSFCVGFGIPAFLTMLWFFRIYNLRELFSKRLIIFSTLTFLLIISIQYLYFVSMTANQILLCSISLLLFLYWHLQDFKKNRADFLQFLLITTWMLLFPILVYTPFFTFQRRLSTGLNIPFAILAIDYIRRYLSHNNILAKMHSSVFSIFIAASSINSLYHYGCVWKSTSFPEYQNKKYRVPIFIEKAQIDAFSIIEKGPNNGSVLAVDDTSHLIPRHTGKQVVSGGYTQTENADLTRLAVQQFYSGIMSSSERLEFLKKKRVAYIFYGPEERQYDIHRSLPEWLEKNHWFPIAHPNDKTYGIFVKDDVRPNNDVKK